MCCLCLPHSLLPANRCRCLLRPLLIPPLPRAHTPIHPCPSSLPHPHRYVSGLRWAGGSGRGAALFTASYDGSLRHLDVERGISGERK